VKIFDFGLSKTIDDSMKARDSAGNPMYGYNLTPRTGSLPYMSPEVVERKPYDEKCDVFSFAILLWEMFALKLAFKGFTRYDFLMRVVRQQERPRIGRQWPLCAPLVLKEAWSDDPQKRPPMKRVATLIRGDLNELSHDDSVINRSIHMRNRSAHSAHIRLLLEPDSNKEGES
jgi:serine/threonine protein kinase